MEYCIKIKGPQDDNSINLDIAYTSRSGSCPRTFNMWEIFNK